MTSDQLLLLMFGIGLVFIFLATGKWPFIQFWRSIKRFYRWLKGERRSYYLCPSKKEMLPPTNARLRTYKDRDLFTKRKYDVDGPIIEIGRGLFRRSAIYGQLLPHWQIKKVWSINNPGWPPGNWVSLIDNEGLPVGKALRLINTYPSLEMMFDRITELEKLVRNKDGQIGDLSKTLEQMKQTCSSHRRLEADLKAGLWILLEVINADRLRYRSQAAQRIRICLEQIYFKFWHDSKPSEPEVTTWRSGPFRDLR